MPPKGKGKKAWGASHIAFLTKRSRKAAGRTQVPVPTTQALNEDLVCVSQGADLNSLDGMMNMLVDISSHLKAIEEGMQEMRAERAATHAQSPSTTRADCGTDHGRNRTRAHHQSSPQEPDLSEAVREVAPHHGGHYNR